MAYYTHDPKVEIDMWYPYNVADYYDKHEAEWINIKVDMCILNHVDPTHVPLQIIDYPFADPQHPLSLQLFSNL